MRDYKTLTNKFNEKELSIMSNIGFRECFPGMYSKRYCYTKPYGWIDCYLIPSKGHMYFRNNYFFTPSQLKVEIGESNEKLLKKMMKEDLQSLKELNIISK